MKLILMLLPQILSVLKTAVWNRFFARFFLRKVVKQTDNLLDDNGLEAVFAAMDNEPERAMQYAMKFVDELSKMIDAKKGA